MSSRFSSLGYDNVDPRLGLAHRMFGCAYQRGDLDGTGYVLHRSPGDNGPGLVGIDLDHCRDPQTGALEPWAQEIIDALNTYGEASPSGEGVRLFLLGKLPPHGRKRGNFEAYETARYVTVTGQHIDGTPTTIEDRQVTGAHLFHTYFRALGLNPTRNFHHEGRPIPVADPQAAAINEVLV